MEANAFPYGFLAVYHSAALYLTNFSIYFRLHGMSTTHSNAPQSAIVIGSGIGGLSLAIRLQAMGYATTVVEKLDIPGGRAYQKNVEVDGVGQFTFDMGPTVLTVPHFIEELFAIQPGDTPAPRSQDFTSYSLDAVTISSATKRVLGDTPAADTPQSPSFSDTSYTKNYLDLRPIFPFYRIYFEDGTYFDYDGDYQNTIDQIRKLTGLESEVEGFKRFHVEALKVFEKGFLELGHTHFTHAWDMIRILPDMFQLGVVRSLFSYIQKYFQHPKTQQVFSFEPLLVGGNPYSVPAIYVMIHFVEKTWGVHYAMGGTGALVRALVQKFEELGGTLRLNAEVAEITTQDSSLPFAAPRATGVRLHSGEKLRSDIVCSNADYAHTYSLVKHAKLFNNTFKTKKLTSYSMSLFVIYFAFKDDPRYPLNLQHHNIILGGEYKPELEAIFKTGQLHPKFSQYLHVPTYTDPSMAPKGYHTAYTLVCVPNKATGSYNWAHNSDAFQDKVLDFIEEKSYIPDLKERLVHASYINPDYFETVLNSTYGNAFGTMPVLRQSAFFRPHNTSRDVRNLYCVGASYQPGAGTPSVMMSAKSTARLIAKNHTERVDNG